jgi:polyisoprenoid-binding protein YceI
MSWNIDSAHTSVNFSVRHMMITNVRGQFDQISGTVEFNPERPAESSIDVRINAASINTREPQRDGHLKSPDFLDVENYPEISFKSRQIEVIDDTSGRVTGDLTIRGVARPVTLEVEYAGMSRSPWGTNVAGFTATTSINRKDWGLTWNVALETGGVLVGDSIKITIEIELVQQAESQVQQSA